MRVFELVPPGLRGWATWLLACVVVCGGCGKARRGAGVQLGQECEQHAECDDGQVCNGLERCTLGYCSAGAAPTCGDGDPCTFDGCQEGAGCVHVVQPSAACQPDAAGTGDAGSGGMSGGGMTGGGMTGGGGMVGSVSDAGVSDGGESSDAGGGMSGDAGADPFPLPDDPLQPPELVCTSSIRQLGAWDDARLANFAGVECVRGSVNVQSVTDLSPLSSLRTAGEVDIWIQEGSALPALHALERVDGDLEIRIADAVDIDALLPALTWVGGRLRLHLESPARVSGLHALRHAGSLELLIEGGTFEGLETLEHVTGDVKVVGHGVRGFTSLTQVDDSLTLGPGLAFADGFDALRFVGSLVVEQNPDLTSLPSMTLLQRVWGEARVFANPSLQRLGWDALSRVGSLEVRLNPSLSRCEVDALLARVTAHPLAGEPLVCCNGGCARCERGGCAEPGSPLDGQSTRAELAIHAYSGWEVDIRAIATVTELLRLDIVGVDVFPPLALREVDWLTIEHSATRDLAAFGQLQRVGRLELRYMDLERLEGLEQLHTVESFQVHGTPELVDLSAIDPARGGALRTLGAGAVSSADALNVCQVEALNASLAVAGAEGRFETNGVLACEGVCEGATCQAP